MVGGKFNKIRRNFLDVITGLNCQRGQSFIGKISDKLLLAGFVLHVQIVGRGDQELSVFDMAEIIQNFNDIYPADLVLQPGRTRQHFTGLQNIQL